MPANVREPLSIKDPELGLSPGFRQSVIPPPSPASPSRKRRNALLRFFMAGPRHWLLTGNQGSMRRLGVLVVAAVFVICLLASLSMSSTPGARLARGGRPVARKMGLLKRVVSPYSGFKNLVLVAGHAVYTSKACGDSESENSWWLEPYQRVPGQAHTFLEHIEAGVKETARDPEALLLFSGGETRKEAGPKSEAHSYWQIADTADWFGAEGVRSRAMTEEHARDSFENLLFSVCRFREITGSYPQNITVVGYDFKQGRFAELHRNAIAFPARRFSYVGTAAAKAVKEAALAGEAKVVSMFKEDPYGCNGALHEKRLLRDPFLRSVPYPEGCPEIAPLFGYCGPGFYPGRLPWDSWTWRST